MLYSYQLLLLTRRRSNHPMVNSVHHVQRRPIQPCREISCKQHELGLLGPQQEQANLREKCALRKVIRSWHSASQGQLLFSTGLDSLRLADDLGGCRSPNHTKSSADRPKMDRPLSHGWLTTAFLFSWSAYLPFISY